MWEGQGTNVQKKELLPSRLKNQVREKEELANYFSFLPLLSIQFLQLLNVEALTLDPSRRKSTNHE